MHAFTRLTSFLLFVLSLSFLTCALPTPAPAGSKELAARGGDATAVLDIIVDLKAKVEIYTGDLTGCNSVADVSAKVEVLIGAIEVAVKAIVAVGVNVQADADIKAQIAAEVAACISLIVQACLSLTLKFGINVLLAILLRLDVCLHLFLVQLGVCIEGVVLIIAKLTVGTCADALVKVHFSLCASILAIVGL